jgi:XRE family transcriptional regulator, aerobic/anaerobic benzoate catabolism transcriptional regulator
MSSAPDILPILGQRLRARRLALGWTQAELAMKAQVSPRFLVQIEGGTGNVSVQRLAEVCAALDLPLAELFTQMAPEVGRKLALVGLRGAGKSSVGRMLASQLGAPFIELDEQVEEEAGMSLGELFELRGEAWYREIEARVLARVLAEPGAAVLAAGGSIVTAPASWERLRQGATTVWLRAQPDQHLERVRAQGDLRPMEGRPDALAELRSILLEREALYGQAAHVVETDGRSLADVTAQVSGLARSH